VPHAGDAAWTDYTLNVEALKTGGSEGFMVYARSAMKAPSCAGTSSGWANSRTAIQQVYCNLGTEIGRPHRATSRRAGGTKITMEVKGRHVRCLLDGKVRQRVRFWRRQRAVGLCVAGRDEKAGEVIIKLVNAMEKAVTARINLRGPARRPAGGPGARAHERQPDDENSLDEPLKVSPRPVPFACKGGRIAHELPPCSVTILRLKCSTAEQ